VTGPGVVLSSFAVSIGFLALATSEFLPFSRFGVMVAIATAGSSIGNLLLLPACISVRAAYLQKRRLKPTVPMPEPLDAIPDDI
jgi:predicted RND superfamily exporter protein